MKTVKQGPGNRKGSPVVYCGRKSMVEKIYGKGKFLVCSGKE